MSESSYDILLVQCLLWISLSKADALISHRFLLFALLFGRYLKRRPLARVKELMVSATYTSESYYSLPVTTDLRTEGEMIQLRIRAISKSVNFSYYVQNQDIAQVFHEQ
jgi:hypothetical protein